VPPATSNIETVIPGRERELANPVSMHLEKMDSGSPRCARRLE
jgi:hypothetical protein